MKTTKLTLNHHRWSCFFTGIVLEVISLSCLTAVLLAAPPARAEVDSFTTLAGVAGGSADGAGGTAQFDYPRGVVVDSSGNIYVADTGNHTIRKITPAGVVTTFAGSAGHAGTNDGTWSMARFNQPGGVAVDSAGNIYVADTGNHAIRRITPTGIVSTFAGSAGHFGTNDGNGSAARFFSPQGVAVDSAGNLYVADTFNHTIRKITPAGVVSTLAGSAGNSGGSNGTGSAARFYRPSGVAADSVGSVYVADTFNHTIRKITPAGMVTTLAGSAGNSGGSNGTGSTARFYDPSGVAVDSAGNVYVADTENNTIRKITPAGVVTTFAGSGGSYGFQDGTGGDALFDNPRGVAVGSAGSVYVADTGNHAIRQITSTSAVSTVAGIKSMGSADGPGSAARFFSPQGVAVDSAGNLYVADAFNHTIRKITPAGVVTTLAGSAGKFGGSNGTGSAARFYRPSGVAVDSAGNVYVADTLNNTIRKITPAGVVTTFAGSAGSSGSQDGTGSTARFCGPGGVAVDSAGNLYVADTFNHTIRKITPAGVVATLAGSAGSSGFQDGTGGDALFDNPYELAVDEAGYVYVADTFNNQIRKITPAGAVSTLVRGLGFPQGVAVDSVGNLYVADTVNDRILKLTPDEVLSTLGGAGQVDSADGTGSAARFNHPGGIAVDAKGTLYVADTQNNTIRKGMLDAGLRAYDGSEIIKLSCDPDWLLTSPVRINQNGITYGIRLVPTGSPNASKFRIRTFSGVKALMKMP